MTEELQPGETVRLEGRAGYEVSWNRGQLTLTNQRLIWEKSFSIDPFGAHEISLPLGQVHGCRTEGDAIVLDTDSGRVYLFVQLLPLSVLTGNRRTKEWLRELTRAIEEAKKGTPA